MVKNRWLISMVLGVLFVGILGFTLLQERKAPTKDDWEPVDFGYVSLSKLYEMTRAVPKETVTPQADDRDWCNVVDFRSAEKVDAEAVRLIKLTEFLLDDKSPD